MRKILLAIRFLLCPALLSALVGGSLSLSAAESGTLRGRFVYEGQSPKQTKLIINKDQDICGAFDLRNEQLVVAEDGSIRDVIIYARKLPGPSGQGEDDVVVLDNKDCRFAPHVVAVRPGQTLRIKNSDPVAHNTDIKFNSNSAFNEGLPPTATKDLKLSKAERKPVSVSCSIHPWMRGYLVVQDTPFIAITKEDGSFEIEGLPVGKEVEFQVAHPKWKTVKFDVDGKPTKRGRFKLKVVAGENDMGDLAVKPE